MKPAKLNPDIDVLKKIKKELQDGVQDDMVAKKLHAITIQIARLEAASKED
jgi:hypothetical protein